MLGRFLCWAMVIFLLYLAGLGPTVWLIRTRGVPPMGSMAYKTLTAVYAPVQWMYHDTPLHKPLGMYVHLWDPNDFDADGKMDSGK